MEGKAVAHAENRTLTGLFVLLRLIRYGLRSATPPEDGTCRRLFVHESEVFVIGMKDVLLLPALRQHLNGLADGHSLIVPLTRGVGVGGAGPVLHEVLSLSSRLHEKKFDSVPRREFSDFIYIQRPGIPPVLNCRSICIISNTYLLRT